MAITSDLDPMIDGQVLALAGGVGGAKLVLGLSRLLPPEQLVIVVNTGDDECFHGLHVFIGTIFLFVCYKRAIKGHFTPESHFGFEAAAWYWHFVDVVWLFLFIAVYCDAFGIFRVIPAG